MATRVAAVHAWREVAAGLAASTNSADLRSPRTISQYVAEMPAFEGTARRSEPEIPQGRATSPQFGSQGPQYDR